MKTLKSLLLGAATLSLLGVQAQAADQKSMPTATQPGSTVGSMNKEEAARKVSATDKRFMEEQSHGNLLEIKLGQLAQQKGESSEVKAFADRMVKDHTDAQNKLEAVAKASNVPLPTDIDAAGKKVLDKLTALSGRKFDLAYMKFNVPTHAKVLSSLRKEEHVVKDKQLADWTTNVIPTVKQHLKLAEQTDRAVASNKPKTTAGRPGRTY